MTTGIYKITNLINGKIYIGQSIHIERRWQEHCQPSTKSMISNAIKKYGKENFSFQIIEECPIEKLNEKEAFYIKQFNSLSPNGYNIEEKQEKGSCIYVKYSKEIFLQIVSDLIYSELSMKEIASKYSLDLSFVYRLNRGEIHHLEELNYPLREVQDVSKKIHLCPDCGKEITKGAKRCPICSAKAQYVCEHPSRADLKNLLRSNTFVQLGRMFSVSDNTIRNWCKNYNLPFKASEIKKMSDEEWQKI